MKNPVAFKIRGLTLIEMIISIAILGMLALYFSPRFIQATRIMEHSRRSTMAANLANQEMEKLRSLNFDEINAMINGDPDPDASDSVSSMYKINTFIIPHNGDGFTVKVLVEAESVIQDEPIKQSVQSYIAW